MKKYIKLILPILVIFAFLSCNNDDAQSDGGIWRLEAELPEGKVPFHLLVEEDNIYALNAGEKLEFDHAERKGDSLFLAFELYETYIEAEIKGDELSGILQKPVGRDIHTFKLTGKSGDVVRFHNPKNLKPVELAGKYEVTFGTGENARPAIGLFEVEGDKVTGTFLTRSGDYRFLQGNVVGDSLFLSAYAGNVVLYKAKITGDSLVGTSFNTYSNPREWRGVKNNNYELPDPYRLTYLNEGYDKLDFTFPDVNGQYISLSDERYNGKITLVEITGTWCPNCMDAATFLKEFKNKNPEVEIIALSFERSDDPIAKIKRYIERFDIDYPVLYGGNVSEASDKLPALNRVMSYPTIIVIDKKGDVRHIYTGFRGPGTGIYYQEFVDEFSMLIEKLEAE